MDIIGVLLIVILVMWIASGLLVPIALLIEYIRDVKEHGKEEADEIWRRKR